MQHCGLFARIAASADIPAENLALLVTSIRCFAHWDKHEMLDAGSQHGMLDLACFRLAFAVRMRCLFFFFPHPF